MVPTQSRCDSCSGHGDGVGCPSTETIEPTDDGSFTTLTESSARQFAQPSPECARRSTTVLRSSPAAESNDGYPFDNIPTTLRRLDACMMYAMLASSFASDEWI